MPLTADLVSFLTRSQQANQLNVYKKKLISEGRRLETSIRNALAEGNHDRIAKIVHQLCHDYAYAVHQPHARNGGLIGLAAAAIALGAVRIERRPMTLEGLTGAGSSQVSQRDCPASPRLLFRSRCSSALLRM